MVWLNSISYTESLQKENARFQQSDSLEREQKMEKNLLKCLNFYVLT